MNATVSPDWGDSVRTGKLAAVAALRAGVADLETNNTAPAATAVHHLLIACRDHHEQYADDLLEGEPVRQAKT